MNLSLYSIVRRIIREKEDIKAKVEMKINEVNLFSSELLEKFAKKPLSFLSLRSSTLTDLYVIKWERTGNLDSIYL
jgi:hypothetical protein